LIPPPPEQASVDSAKGGRGESRGSGPADNARAGPAEGFSRSRGGGWGASKAPMPAATTTPVFFPFERKRKRKGRQAACRAGRSGTGLWPWLGFFCHHKARMETGRTKKKKMLRRMAWMPGFDSGGWPRIFPKRGVCARFLGIFGKKPKRFAGQKEGAGVGKGAVIHQING